LQLNDLIIKELDEQVAHLQNAVNFETQAAASTDAAEKKLYEDNASAERAKAHDIGEAVKGKKEAKKTAEKLP
jgi:hypothetical protein